MPPSKGENWINLLRSYGPIPQNEGQQAEHVDKLAMRLGVPKLAFTHPAAQLLADSFPRQSGAFRNVLLTGTAGDGKTSLCLDLVESITGVRGQGTTGVQTISVETGSGERTVTFVYDVTAWRRSTGQAYIATLERMAESSYGDSSHFFVLAVNDGQMHELFRSLPADASASVSRLERDLIGHHARKQQDCTPRLRLINLSLTRSEQIMELSLSAVLDRAEWICFEEESQNPLFTHSSSLCRNYRALNTPEIRDKLLLLARIADVSEHHLPIRGTLCLLSNALLGHPDAHDRLVTPGSEAAVLLQAGSASKAALHRTLFGDNLRGSSRQKREIYRFLSTLRVGDETTNDLDELLIFGSRDEGLGVDHRELVEPDPYNQRDSEFDALLAGYIRGDMTEDETTRFISHLAGERRRLFLHASARHMVKYDLWKTTVFHHAHEYFDQVIAPLSAGKAPARLHLRKLATGLNRVWVGLLLADNASQVYLATGLDLTTAPISDVYLAELDLNASPPGLQIVASAVSAVPTAVLSTGAREFQFALTLPRFEFLCRVANGAMPSSFSRESWTDFMSLKQQCLRELQLVANPRTLQLIEVQGTGTIQRVSIHLAEQ